MRLSHQLEPFASIQFKICGAPQSAPHHDVAAARRAQRRLASFCGGPSSDHIYRRTDHTPVSLHHPGLYPQPVRHRLFFKATAQLP